MTSLDERVVLVTGAGRGIGTVFARAWLERGHPVAFADLNPAVKDLAAAEVDAGRRAVGVQMDVADAASVADGVAAVTEELGAPLILVNNAALFADLAFTDWEDLDLDEWDRVMAVNVRGPFLCARACAPGMKAAGWGRVINIASTAWVVGGMRKLHYATSKAAVVGFTRALAREVGATGVTVNAIAPGGTESEKVAATYTPEMLERVAAMRAIARSEVPEDLVGAMAFLASDDASFITGQTIVVDGGHVFS